MRTNDHTATSSSRRSTRRQLKVTVVRFQRPNNRPSKFARVACRLIEDHPGVHVVNRVVSTAQGACQALCEPADAVILTGHGYSSETWRNSGTKRPWPGGCWYVGGRGAGDAGMSLDELAAGIEQFGGFRTPLLVVDACEAAQAEPVLRRASRADPGSETSVLLLAEDSSSWPRELRDLSGLIGSLDWHRDVDPAVAGLERYKRI